MCPSISVFDLGYVGSTSAACFASLGHRVTGGDVNPARLELIKSVHKEELAQHLRAQQVVIELVNLDKSRRPKGTAHHEGRGHGRR